MRLLYIFIIATLLLLSFSVQTSAQKTWDGGAGTLDWSTANNWNPNGVPTGSDDVLFDGQNLIISNVTNSTFAKLRLINNSSITLRPGNGNRTVTVTSATNDALVVASGSTLNIIGFDTGTDRTLTLTTANTIGLAASISGTLVVGLDNAQVGARGIFTKGGANATINFNSGSIYQHAVNGGTIPTSSWGLTSTCNITGITTTAPAGINQNYGNFTWNCAGQTANISLAANLKTINGNFTLTSTNASQLILSAGTATTLAVGGNFLMTNGTLNFNSGANVSTMNVAGNFSHTGGTITESGSGRGSIVFNKTGSQIYTSGGTVSNIINFTANSGSILQMGTGASPSTITGGGTFILSSGATLGVTSPDGIVSAVGTIAGNIQTTTGRTFTSGANYIYNGSGTQVTGTGLSQNTPANITFNNPTTVSLSAATTISGNLLISQGTLSTSASNFNLSVGGNWTNSSGTFTPGTGTVTFTGNAASINGTATTQTFNNVTVNKTAGQTLSVTGSTTSLVLNGAFTQTSGNFTAPETISVTGNTTLTAGNFTAPTNLSLAGNFTNNGATFTTGTGTVAFTGNTSSINGTASTTFYNLTINKALSNRQNLGANISVSNLLTLTSGIVDLSNFNLTFGANALAVQGAPSTSNMIVTTGTGRVRKLFTTVGTSFQLPIGEETGTADYSPITIAINSATLAPGALVEANVIDAKHPNNGSATNYLTRYWTVSQVGITNMNASISAHFVPTDTVGPFSNIITSRYITPVWVEQNVATDTTLTATNLVAFGDFTGRNNIPLITVSATSLSGFTYLEGLGPSAEQSFTVSGSALSTNITILPTDNFEISFGSGPSFVASSILNAIVVNREVPSTTVYVRLRAGLTPGVIATEYIKNSSTGVTDVDISCDGLVSNAPLISPTATNLNNFSYTIGAGPSPAQTFNVSGSYLSNGITITPSTNFEISLALTTGYGASILLNQSGGNVTSTTIYVRLKTGLSKGDYVENITLTTDDGITKTVICSGKVNNATVAVSKLSLAGFIYTNGAGPSEVQSVNVSGTFLTQNLTVTPPTNFEISTNSTTGFALTPIIITQTLGTVAPTQIFVRMKAGLATGIIAAQNIVVTSGSAISQNVSCSGQVATVATTISSNGVLNGFFYVVNQGPSLKQNFTVSATSLTTSVTVTPPTNFEISLSGSEGTFVSNPTTLTIAQTGGKVNAIPVYVRLKAGYPIGTYSNQNIVLSSTGASNVNVVCNGTVVVQPTIIAGPTGLENLCQGSSVTLTSSGTNITSQTWTGPNGFTSTAQNPVLGTVTALQNGTYTVSSSLKSGVNLLTNGNFSAGNSNFGSSYNFWTYGTQSYLQNQYTIGPNPRTLNNGFCNEPTGRAGTGGNQMIIDGATLAAGGAGAIAWAQSIEIEQGATYQFSYWVQNLWNASPAILQFYIDGVPTGSVHNVTSTTCTWVQVTIPYTNTGSTRIVQLSLVDLNLTAQGNDFSLDDFEFQLVFQVSSSVNLTVNPTLAPSLVVSASNNPVFANTIVTYTATPTNGGTSPSYQWKVNGVNQGSPTTSTTFDYTPIQGDSISCVLTSTYPCASPQTATNFVKMTVNPRTNYWRGNISTNWGEAENWTGGYVPAAGDDVEFAKKSNNNGVPAERNLQLDINRTIGYLINDSASLSVIIPPNLTLIVNNSIQSTVNPDKVIIKASSTLANGSIIYRNTQNSPLYGTVEMYSPASFDRNGGFNNVFSWQFFGIPLESLPTLPTFYGSYVRELIESDKDTATHWRSLTNTSIIQPFIGYELCQQSPKFYTFKGKLVNSNYNSGQFVKTLDALYPGQHLFANPYTAAMDIKLIEFGSGVEATAYLYATGTFLSWRNIRNLGEQGNGASPGQYLAVPKNQAGQFGISRQVPSMGTLMVRIPSAAASTPSSYVSFNYNNVTMGNFELQRAKASSVTDSQTTTTIEIEGENGADKIWLMSHESYSRGFDNGYDGKKLTGNALSPQFYAVENDGKYQINSVDDINNTTFSFQAGQDTEYKMTIKHDEIALAKYNKIYLHDLVENKIIDISANGTSYNFTASSTSKPVVRFKILSQNTNEELAKKSNTKVYYYDNKLFVQNFSDAAGKVYVYDISGRTIGIKSISANENIQIEAPKRNTYLVKIVVGEITQTTKLFLQ